MGANQATYDLDAAALANWLSKDAAENWWTVDGDMILMGIVDFPCPGKLLAEEIRKRGGRLRVFLPPDRPAPPSTKPGHVVNIGDLADEEGGARAFQLAWLVNDQPGEIWILAEDTIAQAVLAEALGS